MHPRQWTQFDRSGLVIKPGGFYVDPGRAVERAVITHGHADHARKGHGTVVATPETLAIMECRYGKHFCQNKIPLGIHETLSVKDTEITFYPAGHVLGSVQVQVSYRGMRLGVSGDYKSGGGDPTCADYEAVPCDVFLTEATFAYPLFQFPCPVQELGKLLKSTVLFPERPHLLAAYSFGKAQRVIASLVAQGFEGRIYAHGTIVKLNRIYERFGVSLGEVFALEDYGYRAHVDVADLIIAPQGADMVLGPSDALPMLHCGASGWNNVRAHAFSSRKELPMVISDHCDWGGLQRSILETGANEVWVTHGPADSLKKWGLAVGLQVMELKEVHGG